MKDWTSQINVMHDRSNGHNSPFHRHDEFELYVFIKGNATFYTDQEGIPMHPGAVLPIPPKRWHRIQTADTKLYERIYLNLPIKMLEELSSESTNLASCFLNEQNQQINLVTLSNSELKQMIKWTNQIIQLLGERPYGFELKINMLILDMLLMINSQQQADNVTQVELPALISDTLNYIQQHLNEDLSLETIGEALFLSGGHISRNFKKFMGLSIKEYIVNKRIEKAKELLSQGASVEEAAEGSGYQNYYHFIRSFKKITNTTPGRYRIDHRGKPKV